MSRQLGFSLIEILIAITIFMLISFAAYKILNSSSNIKNTVQSEFHSLNENINAELILEKDFLQAAGGVLKTNKYYQNVFTSPSNNGYKIKFLRHGKQSILKENTNDYLLVAYSLEKNNLIRYFWVDKPQSKKFTRYRQIILSGVTSFEVRFFDESSKWHKKWPVNANNSQGSLLSGSTSNKTKNKQHPLIPKAIEIKIVTENNGSSLILIPLPACLNNEDFKILGK
jgi:general secretion pathway protein J